MTRLWAALALGLWLTLAALGPAGAQAPEAPDYDAWTELSEEAQQVLEAEPNVDELEALRAEIAEARAAFLAAQDTNAARIETVQGQLSSLGDPPAEGEPAEISQISERREQLDEQLTELRAPVRAAEEAYTEADGLVAAIDRQIRDAYARELLARDPSPLNPTFWPGAVSFLVDTALSVWTEGLESWRSEARRERIADALPLALPVLAVGLLLVFRSSWWVWLLEHWAVGKSRKGRGVLGFFLSLGQVVLPLLGVMLIAQSVEMTSLGGPLIAELGEGLFVIALPFVLGMWLASALFPSQRTGPMELPDDLRDKMRRTLRILSVVTSVVVAGRVLADLTDRQDVAVSVALYVPRILLALALFRMGRLLMRVRRSAASEEEEAEGGNLADTITRLLGRLTVVAAVAGAALSTAGYSNATQFILIPSVETLALTGLLLVLQRLVYDLYALLTGTKEGQSDALAPVLIGFALTLGALPVYALIWGARVTDLTEIWSRIQAGFTLGETRIAPADFLTFAIVFALVYMLTRFVQSTLRNNVLPKTKLDIGGRNAIVSGLGYVGIFLAGLAAFGAAGIDLSSLALVAGALSVGIGFGLQNVVSNFVSGIILLIERPISQGDWISVNNEMGYVRDISVRSTRIETFDRSDVIVPNADLISGTVTNWTRGNNVGRVIVPVHVAHGSDTRQVEKILLKVAEDHPMVILNPEPWIYFKSFDERGMLFEIRAFLRDVNWVLNVHSDMNHEIAARFAEAGLSIPVTQTDVRLRDGTAATTSAPSGRRAPRTATARDGDADTAGGGDADAGGGGGGDGR